MKKIFLITLFALIINVQNLCGAAEIYEAYLNNEENLKYPVVKTGDTAIDQKINNVIATEIDHFVTNVYGRLYDDKLRFINTNYTIACNEAGNTVILSVILGESYCYMRAAHPAYYRCALNFNVKTGELMDTGYLTDIGAGNPQFSLENVTNQLKAYAESKKISLFHDALPLKELPKNFYWDENLCVHLIFNNYEVAPYAYGIIDLVIAK